MTGRSIRSGLLAGSGLAAFYVIVVGWASGVQHLATQARSDWVYLTLIVAGFGTQIALLVELRHRRSQRPADQATAGAGAGASAISMVACCAHHIADLAPIIGISGAAAFLTDYRVPFMVVGIAINAVGVTVAGRRLWHESHPHTSGGALWHAA